MLNVDQVLSAKNINFDVWRNFIKESKKNRFPNVNREITAKQVRLVGEDGEMIGVVSIDEALKRAREINLDLVEISPNVEPPVCKILDFSRYKYDAKKRLQEAKKKQKKTVLKEMKFKVNIGQGDLDIKIRKICGFLEEGDKVKISLWFKGREVMHKEKGDELFAKIIAGISHLAKVDHDPKMEGKQIIMIVSPTSTHQ